MTDVKVSVNQIAPNGGTSNAGYKVGFIDSAAKAVQNDTLIVGDAQSVLWAILTIDADGTEEAVTISGKTITLTDSTTGAVSGLITYK